MSRTALLSVYDLDLTDLLLDYGDCNQMVSKLYFV